MTIRVLVADDQAIVRDGLVTVLSLVDDLDVVGEAEDGAAAVAMVEALTPDVVLMDLRMPVLDGAAATGRITAGHPQVAVLVLTTHADDDSILTALAAGARGYLTKEAGHFPGLTPREADVLTRIADGRTNPEIAAELFLTVPTVKSSVNQVFAMLGVRTRAEAVARVLR
ncbi:response regulator [Curtobacterium sp. MCPF17_031]|uniref:response regulator transcription factor n=1 Tax=Curtobacterium sp. MCPF17_031 TaxID=2175653 RepID=UPI000DA94F93|nr:response regulator transcription factor [Curtobacterium sp. MCPF17_031]PZE37651.1 DNA-binding response regulator [Curtobacterium sp. MCPF17_031]